MPISQKSISNLQTATNSNLPLCVDLDDSLVKTDTLIELLILLFKKNPINLIKVVGWLRCGKAFTKGEIAKQATLAVDRLPYHPELLQWLKKEHARGRKLYLATASHEVLAQQISEHIGIFTGVVATHGQQNLPGIHKAEKLVAMFGAKNFAYVGNAPVDVPVWAQAGEGIVVSSSKDLMARAKRVTHVSRVFQGRTLTPSLIIRLIRSYQWAKNTLVFVPLFAAHLVGTPQLVLASLFAFISFCCLSSSAYILNDILDLEADRLHPKKKNRPIASGAVSIKFAIFLTPLLLIAGLGLAAFVSLELVAVLVCYFLITLCYSFYIKRLVLIDVFILAILYTVRIFAGAVAIGVAVSTWLATFSMFFFLSLAMVKRFAELARLKEGQQHTAEGRGYKVVDAKAMSQLGTASAYLSALVLALYISSDEVTSLYSEPALLWLIVPSLVYWISRIWFLAHRRTVQEDPLIFALRDPTSFVIAIAAAAIIYFAT